MYKVGRLFYSHFVAVCIISELLSNFVMPGRNNSPARGQILINLKMICTGFDLTLWEVISKWNSC